MLFEADGELLLLESTAKERASMVRPLSAMKAYYTPYAPVDHQMRLFAYGGFFDRVEARKEAKRSRQQADSEAHRGGDVTPGSRAGHARRPS